MKRHERKQKRKEEAEQRNQSYARLDLNAKWYRAMGARGSSHKVLKKLSP